MKSLAITLAQLNNGGDKRQPNNPQKNVFNEELEKARNDIEECGYENRIPALSYEIADYIASARLDSDLRGLLLIGSVGIGKTIGAKIMSHLLKWDYLTTDRILAAFRDEDEKGYDELVAATDFFGREARHVIIDELGLEVCPLVYYGTVTNVMADVIRMRYAAWCENGARTVMTTNLTMKEIRERYGIQSEDRLFQMCRIVEINAKSFRRQ